MSLPKRSVAWECMTEDPDDSQIVWAHTYHDAMQEFDPNEEHEHAQARRVAILDEHAPGPAPYRILLDLGWYVQCLHCGRTICYDNTDDWIDGLSADDLRSIAIRNATIRAEAAAEEAREPGAGKDKLRILHPRMLDRNALRFRDPETVFCNAVCEQDHHKMIAEDEIRAQRDESTARSMFPFATDVKALRYPCTDHGVRVDFGGRHPADWKPGEEHVHIQKTDMELWERLVAERDGRASKAGEAN